MDDVVMAYLKKKGYNETVLALQKEQQEEEHRNTTLSPDDVALINQKEIHWGLLEDSVEERFEKKKLDGEAKESGGLEESRENKNRPPRGRKQGGQVKKLKSPEKASESVKRGLALPSVPVEVERSILEDLESHVKLSSDCLPSVSFYTFLNTHNSLNCAAISHDGSLVAGGFSDSSVKIWDMANQSGNSYTLFQGHSGPVYSTSFSSDGNYVLSSSSDSTVRLWSRDFNANLVCYKGHNYPVWDVQFSPAGHYFASSSHDRTARIWAMDRTQPLRIMAGHLSDVDCVQWHPNCKYIATGSSDRTVRLWDVQSGENVRVFIGHKSMVLSIAMSSDGRYMASGDEDGRILMWDLASGRCLTPLVAHSSCVYSLAFSGEGSVLASGSADCTVKLWDVTASSKVIKILKTLPTKSTPVYDLRFSRRNLLFAAGVLDL